MRMSDTLYKCTVCGRVGTVGRCCGDETREPLNDLARDEQGKIDDISSVSECGYKCRPCTGLRCV